MSRAKRRATREPTHPRPLPGGEQACVRTMSVPLMGGRKAPWGPHPFTEVRGGFTVAIPGKKPSRPRIGMKAKNQTDSPQPPARYSPFWPVFAVFAVLIFLQATYLIDDFKQHSQWQASKTELARTVAQA